MIESTTGFFFASIESVVNHHEDIFFSDTLIICNTSSITNCSSSECKLLTELNSHLLVSIAAILVIKPFLKLSDGLAKGRNCNNIFSLFYFECNKKIILSTFLKNVIRNMNVNL